jgi:glycerophosphoryl diester phosphodiesterase
MLSSFLKQREKSKLQNFICIAHRGASGRWPENTLLAFRQALDAGASWLELDVHLCADGHLVVIHDFTLQRTTDGRGKVMEHSLAELRELDAGMGEKVPLLEEVLDLAAGRAAVNIELKGIGTGQAVARLLQQRLAASKQQQELLASSLNEKELRGLSAILPKLRLGLVAERVDRQFWQLVDELDVWSVSLDKRCIDQALVNEAKARRRQLLVFTVNDNQQLQQLKAWGVDGVFTDFPERYSSLKPSFRA